MQRTEKYFEQDAFRTGCESVILAAEPDEKTGGGRIALDGTVFYPEGGGQPADRGTLTLPDGTVLRVSDVHEQAGIIWHTVDALPAAAAPGAAEKDVRFMKLVHVNEPRLEFFEGSHVCPRRGIAAYGVYDKIGRAHV